jgi:lipopolysaccharide/colanic/teichoic acid biosynthesis glycosyltransferase
LGDRVLWKPVEADVTDVSMERSSLSVGTDGSATLTQLGTAGVSPPDVRRGVPLSLSSAKRVRLQSATKRALDVLLASLLLLVTSPVFIAIGATIAVTCGLPILFRQTRVTRRGRPFTMLKFRTMRTSADRLLPEGHDDQSVLFFKLKTDPRTTRVGGFLRRFSLDELPQLLNVLRGDMSLVGPRPLTLEQVEANRELMSTRHEVRTGITGWWQVNGRNDVTADEALAMDEFYVENWSLWLDLKILLRTVGVVLASRGAY